VAESIEIFNGPWAVRLPYSPGAWELYTVAIAGSAASDGRHAFGGSTDVTFQVDGPEWTLQLGVFLSGNPDPHWAWPETQRIAHFDVEQGLFVGVGQRPHPATDPVHPVIVLRSLDPAIDPGPPGPPLDFTIPEDWLLG
jgi:hypothetical protein